MSFMHKKFFGLSLCCLLILAAGCKKSTTVQPAAGPQTQTTPIAKDSGAAKYDACALLANQEIETIEGSPVTETKPSGRSDTGLSFSQCFFTTAEFNRSVSLSVTQSDPTAPAKRSVKQYWQEMFGSYEGEQKEKEHEQEADKEKRESLRDQKREKGEEAESVPPKKITGVGEEAFWIGSRVGGALYVLKKNAFIRVSVGGPDPEPAKIEKCKALAQKALARL
jgi:hypothetical protein